MRHTSRNTRAARRTAAAGWLVLVMAGDVAQAAIYTVTQVGDSGAGSLRQAILDANLTVEADQIHFAIPGAGVKTIALLSQLPSITRTLTVDGYTQPGASANTLATFEGGSNAVLQIEITGTGGFYGFYIDAGNGVILTVQGVNLHGFISCLLGAPVAGTSQIRSFGNFLCSNVQGDALATGAATGYGIATMRTPGFIGGDLPQQRNLISGCNSAGVSIDGDAQLRGNLISGNHTFGIGVINQSTQLHYANLHIQGNYIGTDWQGTQAVPNGYATPNFASFGGGIQVATFNTDPTPLIIGGFQPGEGNLIAFNHGSGIKAATNVVGEAFDSRGNAIHHNTFGGATNIDVGEFGATPNDPGDPDLGANQQQNHPVIVQVGESGGQAIVRYRVDSLPAHASYPLRIDFHAGEADGSGAWLAQDSYPLDAAGQDREFIFSLPIGVRAFPLTAIASSADHSSELAPVYDSLFRDGLEDVP